jgi:major membrane immunogen (membrane-anchored lipoprotein)
MVKKNIFVMIILMLLAFSADTLYKDGNYSAVSRAVYTDEPFYGHAKIVIEKGKMIKVEFFVRDSLKHEYMDGKYEKYFAGNDEYVQQCRNDWKGIQDYPNRLLKSQDINKVDAVTGATWSYKLFKASVEEALAKAKK